MRQLSKALAAGSLLVAAPAMAQADAPEAEVHETSSRVDRPPLALMGTIPIYWGESAGLTELLAGEGTPHWARNVLERDFTLTPLDYLSDDALAGHDYLLMAQPRGLTGEENVALDNWVRQGGALLLFADPMMTGESRFHIGDRRRPQDVALLSPILSHWGLQLTFDPDQQAGAQMRLFEGVDVPVNLAGAFALVAEGEGEGEDESVADCVLAADGLMAQCAIGEGTAMIVGDAAILDIDGPIHGAARVLPGMISFGLGISREFFAQAWESEVDSLEEEANTDERALSGGHDHGH